MLRSFVVGQDRNDSHVVAHIYVVSFDGTTYRVHSGKQAKVVWQFKK